MSFRDKTDKLLDAALSDSFFGEDNKISYRPASGGRYLIRGIFDESWEEVDLETGVKFSTAKPNVGILLRELPDKVQPKEGDKALVRGCLFNIIDVQEDGQGGATLLMHKAE